MIELFHVARTSIICAKRGRDFLFLYSHSCIQRAIWRKTLCAGTWCIHILFMLCTPSANNTLGDDFFLKLAPYYSVCVCVCVLGSAKCWLRAWACVRKVFEASRSVARAFDLLSRLHAAQLTCEGRKIILCNLLHEWEVAGILYSLHTRFCSSSKGIFVISKFFRFKSACMTKLSYTFLYIHKYVNSNICIRTNFKRSSLLQEKNVIRDF